MWDKILYFLIVQTTAEALIAFDCGHAKMNQTRVSVLSVGNCELELSNAAHENEDIQLLELNTAASIHIFQCKVNVLQTVYYCGMFSHLSLVPGGLSSFIADVSKEECMEIQRKGTYKLQNGKIITDIKSNATTRITETIAGSLDSKGNCEGMSYTFGSHSWQSVIVLHALEITVTDYIGTVRLDDNKVVLRNNVLCPYMNNKCMDIEYGMSFWDIISDNSCETMSHTVLYEGNATKTQTYDGANNETHIIYAVNTGDIIFALEIIKAISVCHHPGYQTEHPRLLIVKRTSAEYLFKTKSINAKNLDLFAYINAKFVYVERHLKNQIQNLHAHLIHKKCELERQVLETQLAVAHQHPSEFAFMLMKEPGFTAIYRGEVVYLIKCQAVEVTVRKTERCYHELPVSYNNDSYYMTPTTHLLHEYGTEIPCSSTLMPAYLIHGSWYGFNPTSQKLESPPNLYPSKDVPWKYEDLHDLIKSGIYSYEGADELRRQIMYPTERKAIENVITKTVIGHDIDSQNINVQHLFSSKMLNQITRHLQPTWAFFTSFGNFSAGFFAIVVILQVGKYLISTLVNLSLIRRIHGRSWWLLGALCDTFTHFIIHRTQDSTPPDSDIQLTSVKCNAEKEVIVRSEAVAQSLESLNVSSSTDLDALRCQTNIYPPLKIDNANPTLKL